jgi:hypothetical protein
MKLAISALHTASVVISILFFFNWSAVLKLKVGKGSMVIAHKTFILQSFPAKVVCLKTGNIRKSKISAMC